jgi:beta-fructofuranosidase
MMFPSMRHPSRYVWDFWYYFDSEAGVYHVFYLNADEILVPSEKHHHAACVGHAITSDFIRMDWGEGNSAIASPVGWVDEGNPTSPRIISFS